MKKRKLFLLPLFCLLLTGCNTNKNSSGTNSNTSSSEVVNNASLSVTQKSIKVDDVFFISVKDAPKDVEPSWSKTGNAVNFEVTNDAKTNVRVTGVAVGDSTITVTIGEKILTCNVTVSAKPVLPAPVLELNAEQNGLVWEPVENAIGYAVAINDHAAQSQDECTYAFATAAGNYVVHVVALAGTGYANSSEATFEYQTIVAQMGELNVVGSDIYWGESVGMGIEYKFNDNGVYADVVGDHISITGDGAYILHSKGGWDNNTNTYYVDNPMLSRKAYVASTPATANLVVEDGSADDNSSLREDYDITYYGSSGWAPSQSAQISLEDTENSGYTDGKCVMVKYFKNSNNFRYAKKASFLGSYDTISVAAKGDDAGVFKLRVDISKQKTIGGVNLTGIYAYITVSDALPSSWNRYYISLEDTHWTVSVAGSEMSVSAALTAMRANFGVKADSFGDLMPYFDTVSFLMKTPSIVGNGPASYFYLDDLQFENSSQDTHSEPINRLSKLSPEYALKSSSVHGRIKVADGGLTADCVLRNGSTNKEITVNLNLIPEDNQLVITSVAADFDFVLTMVTETGGATWTRTQCTGTLKDALTNAVMDEMKLLDDFSGYTETGNSVDSTHTYDAISGMRANYFCDYYSGNNNYRSPVGGDGWSLMQSTNYMDFSSSESHMDANSAKLKASSAGNMRFMSMGVAEQALEVSSGAPAYGKSYNKLSIMAKGSADRDVTIMLWGYCINGVTPSTQIGDAYRTGSNNILIPQNSDWTEYSVNLDTSKYYYGFSIIAISGSVTYFHVDDICLYKTVSPYGA